MKSSPTTKDIMYDIAIIGGGPAGMMAAIRAAELGRHVVLIEKNDKLGKKLLVTGGGRCNVTNATFDHRVLAKKYGEKGKFLLSPLAQFDTQNTVDFFESRGMPTMLEAEGRMFPKSGSAQSVWDVLVHDLKKRHVDIFLDTPVTKLVVKNKNIISAETARGIICAKSFMVTTGGTSRPETGSTGDGFSWLKKLGHTIVTPDPALVPVKTAEPWVHSLQGVAFPNVKITILENGIRTETQTGKILFTHFGISGPLVLNMSRLIGEAMKESSVALELDLFPALDRANLDSKLLEHFAVVQNKKWKNALAGFVPARLAPILAEMSKINPELFVNEIPRTARLAFVEILKSLTITPTGLLGPEKAIVSSGGVALTEIDFKTMRSHIVENLYLAGDVLDFDRPSGGFSLQICWTTGFVAGSAVTKATKNDV